MKLERPYLALATRLTGSAHVGIKRGLSASALTLSSLALVACSSSTNSTGPGGDLDGVTSSSSASTSSNTTSGASTSASVSSTSASVSSSSSATSGSVTSGGSSTGGTVTTSGGMSSSGGPGPGFGGDPGPSAGPTGTEGGTSATTGSASTTGGGGGETESAGCGTERQLMNGRKTISVGGMNRDYILRVPDNYDNTQPYRLIMAYHWLSGNAEQVANGGMGGSTEDPYYGLWDLAENSTIFVAPEGIDAGWANTGDRDINLTDAILEEVQNDLCIDKTRIFATGFSYGGGMSYALACARADVFRGVALYAGAQLSGCNGGTTPIAYFHAHGVGDSVLDVSMGRQLRDHFVEVNGCTPQNPPEPGKNSGTHICTSYEGCSEGHPLRWCAHGGDHNPTEKDSGQSESWVPGEAWDFISQF